MKYCRFCGNKIIDEAKFCSKCGIETRDIVTSPNIKKVKVKKPKLYGIICLILSFLLWPIGLGMAIFGLIVRSSRVNTILSLIGLFISIINLAFFIFLINFIITRVVIIY